MPWFEANSTGWWFWILSVLNPGNKMIIPKSSTTFLFLIFSGLNLWAIPSPWPLPFVRSCPRIEEDARRRRSKNDGHLPPIDASLGFARCGVGALETRCHKTVDILNISMEQMMNHGHFRAMIIITVVSNRNLYNYKNSHMFGETIKEAAQKFLMYTCLYTFILIPIHGFIPTRLRPFAKEHAVVPIYSDSGICNDLGEDFASPTKQYIYACQREQAWLGKRFITHYNIHPSIHPSIYLSS